jgi:hypothetical protein
VVERVGFTPGGKHVWFSTATGDPTKPTWQLYWDGKPEPASVTGVADQFILGLVLSPNGERYTYLITQRGSDGRQIPALVVDGKVTNWPAEQPVFTADGQHLFTKVSSGPGAGIYMDGKPFLPGQGNMDVYPAPVGDVVMIAVNMGGVGPGGRPPSYLTIGNRKVPNTDGCRGPVRFSMDGKHWAAKCGSNSGPQWVVADGKRGQEYQGIASDILFTADGRPVYRASSGDKFFVVAGDRESDAYRNYEAMQKPPDCTPGLPNCPPDLGVIELPAVVSGNHVGYIASPPQSIGFDQLVVIDGKTTRAPRPTEVTFSPDGSRFGYLADKHPVIDGGPPSEYAAVPSYRPPMTGPTIVFSPNGKHYAYVSTAPNAYEGTAIVVDGRLVPTPGVGRNLNLLWTPDSRHLMWLARSGSTPKFMVYVDGDPVLEIDAAEAGLMLQNQPFVYGSMGDDGVWTILAEVNGDVKRFRITPGAGSVESLMSRAVRTR